MDRATETKQKQPNRSRQSANLLLPQVAISVHWLAVSMYVMFVSEEQHNSTNEWNIYILKHVSKPVFSHMSCQKWHCETPCITACAVKTYWALTDCCYAVWNKNSLIAGAAHHLELQSSHTLQPQQTEDAASFTHLHGRQQWTDPDQKTASRAILITALNIVYQ